MLQILRNKAQSTVIQIIVVVIALVFIFWGVGTNLNRNRQAAILVNGEEITFQDYQKAYDRTYQRLSDQFGGNLPKGLAETLNIKQQVINQLVQAALLRQGARKMGITLSNSEIRNIIENMVQFQKNGSFDMERYKTILAANRMAPTKFEQSLRTERLAEVASREIGNFVTVATDFEIQDIYGRLNEKVEVKFARFDPKAYQDAVTIKEEDLKAWFETVKNNYKTPKQTKLRYLAFTFEEVGKKIDIEPARIEEFYTSNKDRFTIPEQRKARHILFTAKKDDPDSVRAEKRRKAEAILARAQKGEDFVELARNNSEGPSKDSGGELGWFDPDGMVPAFAQAVRNLNEGEISPIVETQYGYHIILLEDIKPATVKPLSDVEEEIKKELQAKEAKALTFQVANAAYEGIIGAGSLDNYSAATPDAVISTTDFFEQGKGPDVIKDDPAFSDAAFKLNKGELSSLISGDSGYAIFYAEDVKAPMVPELANVREKVEEDYRVYRSKALAKEAAEGMLKKLQDGGDFTAAGTEYGVKVQKSGLIKQNDPTSGSAFPSTLSGKIFLLSEKEPLPKEVGEADNAYFVYSFVRRNLPVMEADSEEKDTYRQNLIRVKQQQLLTAWLRHMEVGAEITKHQNL